MYESTIDDIGLGIVAVVVSHEHCQCDRSRRTAGATCSTAVKYHLVTDRH